METLEDYTFGELLKQFRVREGMSQQELAEFSQGISFDDASKYH